MVLIGGEPGIGKSTLVLQLALDLRGKKILYVSGRRKYPTNKDPRTKAPERE
jgi:predicted ATP-dependent serine protease